MVMHTDNSLLFRPPSPGTNEFEELLKLNNPQIRYCITAASSRNSIGSDSDYDVYFVSSDPEGTSTLESLMWHQGELATTMPAIHARVSKWGADAHELAVETILPEDFKPAGSRWRKWDSSLCPGPDKRYKHINLEVGEACWTSRMTVDVGKAQQVVNDKVIEKNVWHIMLEPVRRVIPGDMDITTTTVDEAASAVNPNIEADASTAGPASSGYSLSDAVARKVQPSKQDSGYHEGDLTDWPDLSDCQGIDHFVPWTELDALPSPTAYEDSFSTPDFQSSSGMQDSP